MATNMGQLLVGIRVSSHRDYNRAERTSWCSNRLFAAGIFRNHVSNGFVKRPKSRLANPEEKGVLALRRNDEGYA
jgi:hypothetical protein